MENAASIQQRISSNQSKIYACESEIVALYQDIAQLEGLSDYLAQKRRQLTETMECNLGIANQISELELNAKITLPYSAGIKQHLAGAYFQDAQDGLYSAIQATENKIQELHDTIRQKKMRISSWQDAISTLQCELYNLQ